MSLLGLRRSLLLGFPEFEDVRYVKRFWTTTFYCQIGNRPKVSQERLKAWEDENKPATSSFQFEQLEVIHSEIPDPEKIILAIPAPLDLLEDTNTSNGQLLAIFAQLWPNTVYAITSDWNKAQQQMTVTVTVNPQIAGETEQSIQAILDLVLHSEVHRYNFAEGADYTTDARIYINKYLPPERAILLDNISGILSGGDLPELEELPYGSSTYVGISHEVGNLSGVITLFDNIYLQMPRHAGDFPKYYGCTFDVFKELLPTHRIIPVFEHPREKTDPEIVSAIATSEVKRIVSYEEVFLRTIHCTVKSNPLIGLLAIYDADIRHVHAGIMSASYDGSEQLVRVKGYLSHLSEWIARLRYMARLGESAIYADASRNPSIKEADRTVGDLASSVVSYYGKISKALSAIPLCIGGSRYEPLFDSIHLLGGNPQTQVFKLEPKVIGEILLAAQGIPLVDLAHNFKSENIERMRELIGSPRLLVAEDAQKVIASFNQEAREFNDTWKKIKGGVLTGLGVTATALAKLDKFYIDGSTITMIATALAGLKAALPSFETLAPRLADKIQQKLTRATQEGVALAKIKKMLDNID